jgi:hypothetical protein
MGTLYSDEKSKVKFQYFISTITHERTFGEKIGMGKHNLRPVGIGRKKQPVGHADFPGQGPQTTRGFIATATWRKTWPDTFSMLTGHG